MAFDTFSEFLMMGKHGVYVWSAYGASFIGLGALTVHTLRRRSQIRTKLHRRFSEQVTRDTACIR